MKDHNIIAYKQELIRRARALRKNETKAEKALWEELRNKQFFGYHFKRQRPIGFYIYDFYCKDLNLVIEIDGSIHQLEKVKLNDDIKNEYAKGLNLKLLRFTNHQVMNNIDRVLSEILKYAILNSPPGRG